MPNQIIVSMTDKYPFGQCQMPERENNPVLVRKQINTGNKDEHMLKAKQLKKLGVPHSIQIISIFQDPESLQIYYEYVPVKFQIWMKNMSDQLSDNLSKQLYILTTFLAQNRISTVFKPEQLGLDKNYHIKYFLDLENTFYNEFQDPSSLKQKYYRQTNLFIKSFNSSNDKNISNPLFYSLDSLRSQDFSIENGLLRSLPRSLHRTSSVGIFDQPGQRYTNLTESSEGEIPEILNCSKQSAHKKPSIKINFNQKLKIIKQKLQLVKENGANVHFPSMDFEKRPFGKQCDLKKTSILKKPVQDGKSSRHVSIDRLVKQKLKTELSVKTKSKKSSEEQKDLYDSNSSFLKAENKKIRSQRFKTPKNSQSPIQYLDIVKSSSGYVQDFLNVLEDSSQSENNSFEESRMTTKEQTTSSRDRKAALRTQESQNQNQNEDNKWKARFDAVIQNSKKLIDRMKSPPKPIESLAKD